MIGQLAPAMIGPEELVAGVDTHADTHTLAILTGQGGVVATETFPADRRGYADLITFIKHIGSVFTIGVEGTNSYGAGLTRALIGAGFDVKEVLRPTRQVRRMNGKSDPIDAIAAARTLLGGHGVSEPKDTVSAAEQIRFFLVARGQLIRATTAIANSLTSLLVTAPEALRAKYRGLNTPALVRRLAASRPGEQLAPVTHAAAHTLKHLAQAHMDARQRAEALEKQMLEILKIHYSHLLAVYGVGPIVAAQLVVTIGGNPDRVRSEAAFASLCGVAPIPASSGKTNRHRLGRGGDRRGNAALHQIVLIRMRRDKRTQRYLQRRISEGKTKREAMRCLKRAVAREIYRVLTRPQTQESSPAADLAALRKSQGLTLTHVAQALGTWPARISDIEKQKRPLPDLTKRYKNWLLTA